MCVYVENNSCEGASERILNLNCCVMLYLKYFGTHLMDNYEILCTY